MWLLRDHIADLNVTRCDVRCDDAKISIARTHIIKSTMLLWVPVLLWLLWWRVRTSPLEKLVSVPALIWNCSACVHSPNLNKNWNHNSGFITYHINYDNAATWKAVESSSLIPAASLKRQPAVGGSCSYADGQSERSNTLEIKINTLEIKINTLEEKIDTFAVKNNTLEVKINTLEGKINYFCQSQSRDGTDNYLKTAS